MKIFLIDNYATSEFYIGYLFIFNILLALMRPGRVDRILYVPMPEEKTRHDILRINLSKMPVEISVDID